MSVRISEIIGSLDKFLEEKTKELVNPRTYEVKGDYTFHGTKNIQHGLFKIDENNKILGWIHDPNSMCSKHAITGEITHYNNGIVIKFIKIPTGSYANILYTLAKDNINDEITGDYKGIWEFHEKEEVYKIVNGNLGLDGDFKPRLEEEVENKATLRVSPTV